MPHDHAHAHIGSEAGDRRVFAAIGVNVGLTIVQIVAGIFSGSLALVADAVHNLSDAISLAIAFLARRIARRPSDAQMTFGYVRAELVAALVNYTTLVVIGLWLIWEGVARIVAPQPVDGWIVVVVAGVALIVDTVTALLVMGMAKHSANIKAAFLHNVADALGSIAVIVAGALILLYDWRLVDPLVTLAIAGYILWQSVLGLGPVVRILMLGAPPDTNAERVLRRMESVAGVEDVHHLHVWQMDERRTALEAHVVVRDAADPDGVRLTMKRLLREEFDISHTTLELEQPATSCVDADPIGHTVRAS